MKALQNHGTLLSMRQITRHKALTCNILYDFADIFSVITCQVITLVVLFMEFLG